MLGGLLEVGSAVAAVARGRAAERPVAGFAGLEGIRARPHGAGRQGRGQQRGQAVGQQGRRVVQRLGEVRGQGAVYGIGIGPAVEPGGDERGETVDVPFGEQEPGFVTA
ncbi:hypothetical protein ABZX93_19225 [Streptomyces sp. NPDC006632]|uniref:hypothetical protein n=1 Tax=Streptomyces sp. NPDC006632 TaxID=3157182 RepID=UPI00339DD8D9